MRRQGSRYVPWIAVLIYAILIFAVSAQSQVTAPGSIYHLDKVLHVIEYAPLGFLISRALWLSSGLRGKEKRLIFYTLLIGSFYGLSDEFHQAYVPGRTPDVLDALADAFGVFIGSSVYVLMMRKQSTCL